MFIFEWMNDLNITLPSALIPCVYIVFAYLNTSHYSNFINSILFPKQLLEVGCNETDFFYI